MKKQHNHNWKFLFVADAYTHYSCSCGNEKSMHDIITVNGHNAVQSDYIRFDPKIKKGFKIYCTKIEVIENPNK